MAFGTKLLKHDGCAPEFQPAPPQLAVNDPLVFHGEADAVRVVTYRLLHIGHVKEGHDLPNVDSRFSWRFEHISGPALSKEIHR